MAAQKDSSRRRQAKPLDWGAISDVEHDGGLDTVTEADTADHGLDVTAADAAFTNATGRRCIRLL